MEGVCHRVWLLLVCFFAIANIQHSVCDGSGPFYNFCPFNKTLSQSHRSLKAFPSKISPDIVCLILSYNKISAIGNELHTLTELRVLNISFNDIKTIAKNAFQNTTHLVYLDIQGNGLKLEDPSCVPLEIFKDLNELEVLHIEDNVLNMDAYREDIFPYLKNLKELHMDGKPNCTQFGTGFSLLKSLQKLSIYGKFDKICNETLTSLNNTGVSELYIKSGRLGNIEMLAFAALHNLTLLNLDWNTPLGFEKMSRGCYGLKNTKLETLSIQGITKPDASCITLKAAHLRHLKKTNIKHLYLDHNAITNIVSPVFKQNTPKLETLSASYNAIQFSSSATMIWFYLLDIMPLLNLKRLVGSHQMDYGYIEEKSTIKSFNYIHEGWYLPIPKKLEEFIFVAGVSHAMKTLPRYSLQGPTSLKLIDVSMNNVRYGKGPLVIRNVNSSNDVIIRATRNNAVFISPDLLSESIKHGLKVVEWDLTENKLGEQLAGDKNGSAFGSLRDLKRLNLSSNEIKELPCAVFKNLDSLESLNLSRNSLHEIRFSMLHMVHLHVLDLSRNSLTYLDENTTQKFDQMAERKTNNLTIIISGNPLICSCATLKFLQWMVRSAVQVAHLDETFCTFDNNEISVYNFIQKHIQKMEKSCSSKWYVSVSGAALGVFLFIIGLSLIIYRHKWDLKFYCLKLVQKRKLYHVLEQHEDCQYDAFVCYHVNDVCWVKNTLLPELERSQGPSSQTEPPLKLCLHHRDFVPGMVIEENIINSINNSYKTILVLTKNFVQSEWCEFELHMARMKCFDKGRDVIVAVILEPVPASLMSKTLQAVIKRNTFIEWPENLEDQGEFWRRLKEAIRAPERAPLVCECGRYVRQNAANV